MSRSVTSLASRQAATLAEVAAAHPDVPRLIVLKTDVQRRGVFYTDRALSVLDPKIHSITGTHIFGTRDGKIAPRPESLLLRDGTSIIITPTALEEDPYVVDAIGGIMFNSAFDIVSNLIVVFVVVAHGQACRLVPVELIRI